MKGQERRRKIKATAMALNGCHFVQKLHESFISNLLFYYTTSKDLSDCGCVSAWFSMYRLFVRMFQRKPTHLHGYISFHFCYQLLVSVDHCTPTKNVALNQISLLYQKPSDAKQSSASNKSLTKNIIFRANMFSHLENYDQIMQSRKRRLK